jgi:co-chaperonin GroES (HSP10)
MIGARIFNQKMKQNMDTIYGCVTTADQWLFMKLEGNVVYIDTQKYAIQQLDTLLGILQYIIDQYK